MGNRNILSGTSSTVDARHRQGVCLCPAASGRDLSRIRQPLQGVSRWSAGLFGSWESTVQPMHTHKSHNNRIPQPREGSHPAACGAELPSHPAAIGLTESSVNSGTQYFAHDSTR